MDWRSPVLAHIASPKRNSLWERRPPLEVIPELVRDFITKHIHSVDILEILLLLRQEPRKEWGALAVSKALRVERMSVLARLQGLVTAEVVSTRYVGSEEVFRYDPATSGLGRAVNELAKWYLSHRVALISFIYSNPDEQVRTYPDSGVDDRNKK